MKTMSDDEEKKVRSRISENYGDIAIVGFGKSVLNTVDQITVMPYDEIYSVQTKIEEIKFKEKQRRLIIVITDMNEVFVRENLSEFLRALAYQKICVVLQNAVENPSLMQEIERYASILNTNEQEERDMYVLVQRLYDLVSHQNESLTYLDEDKNYYQLTSDTFFKKGSKCYLYSSLSLEDKVQTDTRFKTRLASTRHCWLKISSDIELEKAARIMETIESEIDEDADFFFYGPDEESGAHYLLLIV